MTAISLAPTSCLTFLLMPHSKATQVPSCASRRGRVLFPFPRCDIYFYFYYVYIYNFEVDIIQCFVAVAS